MRTVQGEIDRLAQFQIDSVNVTARAHLLPLFTRLGNYDVSSLSRAAGQAPRRLFEYWGHAASLIDVNLQPALRFRMAEAEQHAWSSMRRISRESPGLVEQVLAEVRAHGPITARGIEHDEVRDRSNWGWNWSSVKMALEWLFYAGEISVADRNASFERRYDVPDRVLPPKVLATPDPSREEAHVLLARRAARALGVFSTRCVADYFRTSQADTARALANLANAGEIEPVEVAGWPARTWLWAGARIPRRVAGRALVCPFDPLIFERSRALAIFGLDYRIEIYVPEADRRHGYYVYPFLLDDSFAARVDLKADRHSGRLLVRAAWLEATHEASPQRICAELNAELDLLATWLGLESVIIEPRGDLAPQLAAARLGRASGGN